MVCDGVVSVWLFDTNTKKGKDMEKKELLTVIGWDHNKYSHPLQCVNYNFDRNDSKNKLLIL